METKVVEALGVLLRWAHVASAAALVGGLLFARMVVHPLFAQSLPEERAEFWTHLAPRFRSLLYAAIAGLVISGLYNLLAHPGHSPYYHMWFGIKMLFSAHVFAAALLSTAPDDARRPRRLLGAALSGLFVILLAAYLRRIF
jgi:uncharacterized membrane protein